MKAQLHDLLIIVLADVLADVWGDVLADVWGDALADVLADSGRLCQERSRIVVNIVA